MFAQFYRNLDEKSIGSACEVLLTTAVRRL